MTVQSAGVYLINFRVVLDAQAATGEIFFGIYDVDTGIGISALELSQVLSTAEQMNVSVTGLATLSNGQTVGVGAASQSPVNMQLGAVGITIALSAVKISS